MTDVKLKIFTDGGARGNPGPAAIGFVVIDEKTGKIIQKFGCRIGVSTNNTAEYLAVVEALRWIEKNYSTSQAFDYTFEFFLDSQLAVKQLNGFFKIKKATLRNLIIEIRRLERKVGGKFFYHLIPREENQMADKLVNFHLAEKS